MEKVVILGASGHAGVIIDAILEAGGYDIVGLLDDVHDVGENILGFPVIGGIDDIQMIAESEKDITCAIAIGDNYGRKTVEEKVLSLCSCLAFLTVIHPQASVSESAKIGEGSVILAGAVIGVGAILGKLCLLNTNASLDHDSFMGDYSSLAPNVATGGNIRIGKYTAVGIGANLLQGIEVGKHSVIGAGSLVVENIGPHKVAYGTPAKEIRDRGEGESYL